MHLNIKQQRNNCIVHYVKIVSSWLRHVKTALTAGRLGAMVAEQVTLLQGQVASLPHQVCHQC